MPADNMDMTVEEIAQKDVPTGVKYKIVNISNDGFISKRRSESYQDCITINTEKGRIIGIIYWKIKFLILNLISH